MKKYHRKAIFYKTFTLLFTLSILTLGIFIPFITYLVQKNESRNIDEMNLRQLSRISGDVDLVFDQLEQEMKLSLWSSDFLALMLRPDQRDANLDYRVLTVLESQVNENDLIRKTYLYLPFSDQVYVYTGVSTDRQYLGDRELIDQYLSIRGKNRNPTDVSEQRVLIYNRRIFLAQDFCLPNYIGTLFYELDRKALYRIIQQENSDFNTTIYVYDQNDNLLFDYMAAGPQAADFSHSEKFKTDVADNDKAEYYLYASDTLGWKYLVRINKRMKLVPLSTLAAILLPVLLLYFGLSQIFSLYITKTVYRPINRLMKIITDPEYGKGKSTPDTENNIRNEVDFLEKAYLSTVEENEQHQILMLHIGDDILEQLLRNILLGRESDEQIIQRTLWDINRESLLTGSFTVIAGEFSEEEMIEDSIVQQELGQRAFHSAIHLICSEGYQSICVPIGSNRAALVICFEEGSSVNQIKELLHSMEKQLMERTEDVPYTHWFGTGGVCRQLADLRFVWQEALEKVRHQRYVSQESMNISMEAGMYNTVSEKDQYFHEQLQVIFTDIAEGNLDKANHAMHFVLGEIEEDKEDGIRELRLVIENMAELLISAQVRQEDMEVAGFMRQEPESLDDNMQKMLTFTQGQYQKAVSLILDANRRIHNRYVEAAKNYVMEYYMEGTLTLERISNFIGISPAYLSRIFSEATGEGLNIWINMYKIEQAKRYLMQTGLNISEVGYKCGFNSAQSFARVFKKYTGQSPKQFREKPEGKGE